jgi:hypothetical protein
MKRIPGVLMVLVYVFYLYLCVHNLFGDTDPVLIGLDIFCGAACLGGIVLFVALILEGKPANPYRRPLGNPGGPVGLEAVYQNRME